MKLKKFICIALSVALINTSIVGCGSKNTESKDTIKIGHAVALTGGAAIWGISEKEALEMYIEKINANGGVLGKQIEYIPYDTKADQVEGVNVAKRLLAQGVSAIIGPGQSGVAIAMASVTDAAGVPFISTSGTNPKVTVDPFTGLHRSAFRACFIDPFQGKVGAQFSAKELGAKTAAIVYNVGSDYSQGLTQYFTEEFTKNGGNIVATEAFSNGELDFRAVLGKIKDTNPDVIWLPVMQNEAALIMKQARDLGFTCKFIGGDGWASPELVSLGGPATEGSYYVNLASQGDPEIQDFIKEYKDRWGKDPVLPNCLMAIDALYLIIDAIEKTNSTDSEKLIAQFEQTKDLQVLTGKLTIDLSSHNPLNKPAVIETVKNGQLTFYMRYLTE